MSRRDSEDAHGKHMERSLIDIVDKYSSGWLITWLTSWVIYIYIYTSIDPPVNVYIDVDYPLFVDHFPNGSHWFSTVRDASIVGWVYKPTYIMQNLLILVDQNYGNILTYYAIWVCIIQTYIYIYTYVCMYIFILYYLYIYIYHLNMFIRESWGYLKLLMHWE